MRPEINEVVRMFSGYLSAADMQQLTKEIGTLVDRAYDQGVRTGEQRVKAKEDRRAISK